MDGLDTDVILVRCRLQQDRGLLPAADQLCNRSGLPLRLYRAAWSAGTGQAFIYGRLPARLPVDAQQLGILAARWRSLRPDAEQVDVSRLLLMLDVPGSAQGSTASHHYVVETDPEPGWAEEIARWYEAEHMPGLAAVQGCIHARRFINQDAGPRSLACYDLVGEAPLRSPAWLAVRGTEWSARARPHFTNTRRTMLKVVD